MREEPDSLKTPEIDSHHSAVPYESEERRRMNQIANEVAKKGQETEKEYDQSHRIPATGPGGVSS